MSRSPDPVRMNCDLAVALSGARPRALGWSYEEEPGSGEKELRFGDGALWRQGTRARRGMEAPKHNTAGRSEPMVWQRGADQWRGGLVLLLAA
jgi:hypothetical protein